MNLSKNFTLEEFTASSTAKYRKINNIPDSESIKNLGNLCQKILQPIRDKFGKPIRITSGYRNKKLNHAVRGSSSSQHLKGEAADIISDNNKELWDVICAMLLNGEIAVGQLIDEKNLSWIHISLPIKGHYNQILHL